MRFAADDPVLSEPIINDDPAFAQLREEQPTWYVANCIASQKLHRASCPRQAPTNGVNWTSYPKVCGSDRIAVEDRVRELYHHGLTECAFCLGRERRT